MLHIPKENVFSARDHSARIAPSSLSHSIIFSANIIGHSDAPEFEFCIVTAKYLIECAAINPVLAEVRIRFP